MKRIMIVLLLILLLTGCSARAAEPEDTAIIRALAFDRAADGGYRVTAYIAGAEEAGMVSAEAPTVAEAFFLLNTRMERRCFLGQLQTVLFSAEIGDLREAALYLYGSDDVRSAAKILVISGKAEDALEYRGLYRETAEDIVKMLENASENGNYTDPTLYSFVNCMAAEYAGCSVPTAQMHEKQLVLEKATVYRGFRAVQTVSAELLAGAAMFAEKENVFFTAEKTGFAVSGTRVKISVENGKNRITVRCTYKIVADAAERPSESAEAAAEKIEQQMREVWELAAAAGIRLQGMQGCDPALPAVFEVSALPAHNDYPLKGVFAK